MKKSAITGWITILSIIGYVIFLLSLPKEIRVEKEITFMNNSIPLPFEVSSWWFIFIFPSFYFLSNFLSLYKEIRGEKPKNPNNRASCVTRSLLFVVKSISLFVVIYYAVINAIIYPLNLNISESYSAMGPVSSIPYLLLIWLCGYLFFGALISLGYTFIDSSFKDKNNEIVYTRLNKYIITYTKQGFISTIPLVSGMIIAVTIISVIQRFKALFQ